MLFDIICKQTELYNELGFLKDTLRLCNLFKFTVDDAGMAAEESLSKGKRNLTHIDFLPYGITYLESESSVEKFLQGDLDGVGKGLGAGLFLIDLEDTKARQELEIEILKNGNQNNPYKLASNEGAKYYFVRFSIVSNPTLGYFNIINTGTISLNKELMSIDIIPMVNLFFDPNKDEKWVDQPPMDEDAKHHLKGALMTFMILLNYINSPSTLVLKESPKKPRISNKKITRAQDRPKYTIIKPNTPLRSYGFYNAGTGSAKGSHKRRKHTRELRSDKFIHKQGQVIKIPACYVGPLEAQTHNKKYQVILKKGQRHKE